MANKILQISFIGYGNIAKAIAKSLVKEKNYCLKAAAPSLKIGVDAAKVATHNNNLAILTDADLVILALKPANMQEVLAEISPAIPPNCLVISVATGLNLAWLKAHLPKDQPIVRSMPNVATAVKKGATPLIANEFVTKKQKNVAARLFKSSGIITWLEDEALLDIYTALSGSGPAYIFLFLEEMANAAEKLGLKKDMAKKFALQTVIGAAALAQGTKLPFSELRKSVTSKGGTTAAAIKVFHEQNIAEIMYAAIKAAYIRAQELGEDMS
ncbi:MAG: pyrroline-5-carboxylate reductase [Legionellales bacterium RIFCSPHIGHO2_12_FULL_37_14]|nr:MAG: pyrroline-5-carboxylate reductase [Legionellales bacterium RIFCSPHIGHO2_12_FULL_37_14]